MGKVNYPWEEIGSIPTEIQYFDTDDVLVNMTNDLRQMITRGEVDQSKFHIEGSE